MKTIAFFVMNFSERGTETATYDYAHYNETILGNKSYIVCFKHVYTLGLSMQRIESQNPFERFNKQFTILTIEKIEDIRNLIISYNLDVFYNLTNHAEDRSFQYSNKEIWQSCRTVKHCVFDTRYPDADIHLSISDQLNKKYNTNITVLPHMIDVNSEQSDLRKELNIPSDAIVFGRYGGSDTFNIDFVKEAVVEVARNHRDKYFIFMNTPPFCDWIPNVIFLGLTVDQVYKRKFINTCNAFLHARKEGETFGLSIGEFAVCLKPILTHTKADDEAHLQILKDKAIIYIGKEDLIDKLITFSEKEYDMTENGYLEYTPVNIMKLFDSLICF